MEDTSVTGNPIPLVFDLGGMNPLTDSIPGFEYSSCLEIAWTSIFHYVYLVAKSILNQHVGHMKVCELCPAMKIGDGDWLCNCIHVLKICEVNLP